MSSRNVAESIDPMSAFVDMSEELVESEESSAESEIKTESEVKVESEEPVAKDPLVIEPVKKTAPNSALQEPKKVDVLDMLHDTTMSPKASVLQKNTLPLKLQNELAEKQITSKEAVGVGTLHDLLEVARQHANGYQRTWDDSIRAYARHMGFPAMASLEDCKMFLSKWGAKLKD